MEQQDIGNVLQTNLEHVKELLEKHRLVETLTHSQETPRHELVESLTHRQNVAELRNRLDKLHVADIAYIVENLPPKDRTIIWQETSLDRRGDVLVELTETVRQQVAAALPREELTQALRDLDPDDLSYIADDIPEEVLRETVSALSAEERSWLTASISYPEDMVGHYMSGAMFTVRDQDRLEDVILQLRAKGEIPSHTDKLFVLDRRGLFKGVLPIPTVLLREPGLKVHDVMASDVVKFRSNDKVDEAALAFERYDLVSAPVLNERGKLVGRLTVDVMMDHLRESNAEDMLRLAGLSKEEDMFVTIWKSARNRWMWLTVNLCTAFIASRIIGVFEGSIEKLVALAALMPIVASIAGNTGNQTTALVLRAISLGQLNGKNVFYMVRKEVGISMMNGMVFGVIVGLFAYVFYDNWALGLVICGAMLLELLIAAGVGLAVPITLEKLGKDPALGASVVITATTDSTSFFIFLGLATIFLV